MPDQLGLFEAAPLHVPPGFKYETNLVTLAEEDDLLREIRRLPFREFEFHGFTGKRRVVSFGWKYDFSARGLQRVDEIPSFLLPVRAVAARFADVEPESLKHALVTEYSPGAAIGWHRDKDVFDDVIGVSLASACDFRFRRDVGGKWERMTVRLEPRSCYLLRGPARTEWEHSIPGVESLRYSITFRNFADA